MSARDLLGLALSYLFAFGLLGAMEFAQRRWSWPRHLTRKVIHLAAGTWVIGVVSIFEHWWWGLLPSASFIVLNYLFYRRRTFQAMDPPEAAAPGTVYFALSVTLVLAAFWPQGWPGLAVAALMPVTWGDGLAAIVGHGWGRHRYRIVHGLSAGRESEERSWEGSAAMFLGSLVATWGALQLFGLASLREGALWSLIVALSATPVEAISPRGTDNLTIPFLAALLLYLLIPASR
ncbi:MAG: phosphatidate cytidylyltransferase [Chloroflexi bacterium]|nr:phosphatidate cytidylyltransferase [Chloroflexota bacterium]